jgi:hypothetical protein
MNFIVALLIPAISALMVNVSPNIDDVEAIVYSRHAGPRPPCLARHPCMLRFTRDPLKLIDSLE